MAHCNIICPTDTCSRAPGALRAAPRHAGAGADRPAQGLHAQEARAEPEATPARGERPKTDAS